MTRRNSMHPHRYRSDQLEHTSSRCQLSPWESFGKMEIKKEKHATVNTRRLICSERARLSSGEIFTYRITRLDAARYAAFYCGRTRRITNDVRRIQSAAALINTEIILHHRGWNAYYIYPSVNIQCGDPVFYIYLFCITRARENDARRGISISI